MSGLEILFESGDLLAINKPPGRVVIPGRDEAAGPSLREELEEVRGKKVYVVHRLDRDTSGVLLFALTAGAHRAMSSAFEAGLIKKRYLALVEGRLEAPMEVNAELVPARRNRMRVAYGDEQGKPARTLVAPLEQFASCSWVEARPLTGRTHQIRVHLGSIGHRLFVDPQYGRPHPATAEALGVWGDPNEVVLGRTPLHAAELEWPPLEELPGGCVEAPLWLDLEQMLQRLRGAAARYEPS